MALDPKVLRRAINRLNELKADNESEYQRRRTVVYARCPRISQIDRELKATMAELVGCVLKKSPDTSIIVERLKQRNLDLQQERKSLLISNGFRTDYIDDSPNCPLCGDTGYVGASMCRCLKTFYIAEQKKDLSNLLKLGSENFDTFSFDYYSKELNKEYHISPRDNIELVYEICLDYSRKFSSASGNLFFNGGTGLGKTFLASCIARDVSEKGFSVVYDTAVSLFDSFESLKFGAGNQPEPAAAVSRFLNCDLLIVDDLGTEMTTQFTVSALYNIINTRLMKQNKTIITSNLSMSDIRRRYSPQIVSRLEGEYMTLVFFGDDIRMQKKLGKYSKNK